MDARNHIYVALLDEGTDVWRRVPATGDEASGFEIVGPMPADEVWQFRPGAIVRCEPHRFADGSVDLVAIEAVR
jgi:hypothetical protein